MVWFVCALAAASESESSETFLFLAAETVVPLPYEFVEVRLKSFVDHPLGKRVSLTAFALVMPEYAQLYAGPTLHVKDFSFGLRAGMETAEIPLRGAASIHWASGHFSALAVGEYGGSGYWYTGHTDYSFAHDRIGLGAFIQRFDGLGPRLVVNLGPITLWGSPTYDFEDGSTSVVATLEWRP